MALSDKVVYTSRVRIERKRGPLRLAYLPAEKAPVVFGVHSEVAEHYLVTTGLAWLAYRNKRDKRSTIRYARERYARQ